MTPSATPALSVIVCSYNRSDMLSGCIEALGDQLDESNAELIVIDDGSSDGTQRVLAETKVPLVAGGWSVNRGLNAARNEGLRLASAPIVLYFDDDQLPPTGYLLAVRNALLPEYDGVGGPLRDQGGGLRTCERCSLGDSTLGNTSRRTDRLIGGNMALRASGFGVVGPFDERLSGRGDETEWFNRAKELNFFYSTDLWVWHRRDSFTVAALCKYAFRQGRAAPVFERIAGAQRSNSTRLKRALRYLGHAMRHRCSHGVEMAFREFGALSKFFERKRH